MRTFGANGRWEQEEVDVEKWAGRGDSGGKLQKVWKTTPQDLEIEDSDGNKITKTFGYLSVNAVTLEGGEGGVDLRAWHENGWVYYVDSREHSGGPQLKPFYCGMY